MHYMQRQALLYPDISLAPSGPEADRDLAKMDPFNMLPPELRLHIFFSLRSKRSILQFLQASPVMLQQYVTSKAYIARTLLTSDLDDEMVQDAMGIILFTSCNTSHDSFTLIRRHIDSWAAQQLPNPFRKQYRGLFSQLEKLYNRLILFIEDYLTKATAIFPPREYLCLSNLSPIQTHLMFKGNAVSARFDAADLTNPERKRLLRAFLRYELLSKIHNTGTKAGTIVTDESLLYSFGGREFQLSDQEAMRCVHRYLESLYGAMFAQCSDSWLPEIPMGSLSSRTTGLLYPDSLLFNADVYAFDMGLRDNDISTAPLLAGLGFDLVTTLLPYAMVGRHGRDCLKQWFMTFYKRLRRSSNTQYLYRDPNDMEDEHYEEGPGMYQVLYPHILDSFPLHRNIYRQRAWVFFDNARFYPSSSAGPHFPTLDELGEQAEEIRLVPEWFLNPKNTRALHRSQKWHDERDGRSSDDHRFEESQDSGLEMEDQARLPPLITRLGPFWR